MARIKSRDIKNTEVKMLKKVSDCLRREKKDANQRLIMAIVEEKETEAISQEIFEIEEDLAENSKPVLKAFIKLEMEKVKRPMKIRTLKMKTDRVEQIEVGDEMFGRKIEQMRINEIGEYLSTLIVFDDESFAIRNDKHKSLLTYIKQG